MHKKTLKKDIIRSISHSKGRFFSIMALMMLGAFTLVGLKVTGPDMRQTSSEYVDRLQSADLTVISTMGIDKNDQQQLNEIRTNQSIEYGYLKDVTIKNNIQAIRVYSMSQDISKYDCSSGRLPKKVGEIALSENLRGRYHIGQSITIDEKKGIDGNYVLSYHDYRVVGFVRSSEILSNISMGQSTAGSGELKGYAVVTKENFDSDYYMLARISYKDLRDLNPYQNTYKNRLAKHKNKLENLLENQGAKRLNTIQTQYQEKIDQAQEKIDQAHQKLADTQQQLADKSKEVKEKEQELAIAKASLVQKENELTVGKNQLAAKKEELASGFSKINQAQVQLVQAKSQIQSGEQQLNQAQKELADKKEQINQSQHALEQKQQEFENQVQATQAKQGSLSSEELQVIIQKQKEVEQQLRQSKQQIDAANQAWQVKNQEYQNNLKVLQQKQVLIAQQENQLNEKKQQLNSLQNQWNQKMQEAQSAEQELTKAKNQLAEQETKLQQAKDSLASKQREFNTKRQQTLDTLTNKQKQLNKIKDKLDQLSEPSYKVQTRREIPGSDGYRMYGSIGNIVDALANVFPIFLFFVAALVTATTMTRFVDEERIISGTLKALGYDNRDIHRKFVVYGLLASFIGTTIGVLLGHILLPYIVHNAYHHSFVFNKINLEFHLGITAVAYLLAIVTSVVPVMFVTSRELKEKPARLLLPKAPVSGTKILLEKIPFIWSKMSFTHKVTARNIFRYKERMWMTIFGVAGSVALLFAGFSVQHSIRDLNTRQFGELIRYDLVVAKNDSIQQNEQEQINQLLNGHKTKEYMSVYYQDLNIMAGKNNDDQEIKLFVPQDASQLAKYFNLTNRSTQEKIKLTDDSVVISERLAKLLKVQKGDYISLYDDYHQSYKMKITDITEMYIGHFVLMNQTKYQKIFHKQYQSNAYFVNLKDDSLKNVEKEAAKYMKLTGVQGVVQNTTMMKQVNTIVHSLDKIMRLLIVIAILLAIVILYNLTNINVSERIRELSTIKVLGFYDKEVTLYIYRETILLTVIGMFAGFILGEGLHQYILNVVPPENVMFNPALGLKGFIIPSIIISVVTAILGMIIYRRLKYVDMLAALKSVE